jgi:hypothetical protein
MPWLTDLDAALRVAGLRYWTSPGWKQRGHGPMSDIRAIFIHHTAGGGTNDWKIVQNGRRGLTGPLAQLTLERDGLVRILAAGQSWHAGSGRHPLIGVNNGNIHCIGIEGVSPGIGPNAWTAEQRREYPRLAAALCRHYKLTPAHVIFHKEWATPPGRKIDASGWDPNAFRRDVAQILRGQPEDDMAQVPQGEWNVTRDRIARLTDGPNSEQAMSRADGGHIHTQVWNHTVENYKGEDVPVKHVLTALEQRINNCEAALLELLKRTEPKE